MRFFVVVSTQTKCVINKFAPGARIIFLIFQCHTVTNGTDLRRSPQEIKINEWGDQIVPIPIQRKNCIENVCLRKEIPVNSAESQEFAQPLFHRSPFLA